MYKLVITQLASDDLESIVQYISTDLNNPSAAGKFLNEVEKCYNHLINNPFIYAKSSDLKLEK